MPARTDVNLTYDPLKAETVISLDKKNGQMDFFSDWFESYTIIACSVMESDCVTPAANSPVKFVSQKPFWQLAAAQNIPEGYKVDVCISCENGNSLGPGTSNVFTVTQARDPNFVPPQSKMFLLIGCGVLSIVLLVAFVAFYKCWKNSKK